MGQPWDIHYFFYNIYHPGAARLTSSLGNMISVILPTIIVLAGILLLLLTIRNGLNMITQAGRNLGPADLARMRNAFAQSLIGFLLVVSAYFILQIISYVTGVNFLNPPV